MPPPASGNAAEEQHLLDGFATYDQHVDVVSALEWLFTTVKGLKDTVAHFERFPRIPVPGNKKNYWTPDFTVLFTDGTAIVGEIAQFALHEGSVDKLCTQIGRYATLTRVPDAQGGLAAVHHVDLMLLVQMKIGLLAVQRIIADRLANPDHPYDPPRPPCIVQFARTESYYLFQRLPDPSNGDLYSSDREPHIGTKLREGLPVEARFFADTKSARGFINDPIQPLYLATHLWTRTWRTMYGGGTTDITIDEKSTTTQLQSEYGVGRISVVRDAMALLERAGLAANDGNGTWTVSRKLIRRSGDGDIHKVIAKRATSKAPPPMVTRRPATKPQPTQDTLF
ncbi:hypothetical protein [Blastococcus sp. TF02A-35]|uniref:hypothetical protein n=1 Tax=Blastococcus sp. TF02A-35 TaxID=2559612 RepID=UPI0010743B4F|nr:hypothetical protein [Blastococcus sp. TF02A_35]TFV43756.1 hypothetical protein E4P43_19465 [Blastococcus sp. TF02A_35]